MEIDIGKEYRYKELCEIVGQKRMSGKQKQLQVKKWHSIFNMDEVGEPKRYIIHQINEDRLYLLYNHRLSKYSMYIDNILRIEIPRGKSMFLTTCKIMKICGMVNEEYFELMRNGRNEYIEKTYDDVYRQIINNCLRSMEKQGIIVYKQVYKYRKNESDKYCIEGSSLWEELNKIDRQFCKKKDYIKYFPLANKIAKERFNIDQFSRCKYIKMLSGCSYYNKDMLVAELNKNIQSRLLELGLDINDIERFSLVDVEY